VERDLLSSFFGLVFYFVHVNLGAVFTACMMRVGLDNQFYDERRFSRKFTPGFSRPPAGLARLS
jgi:hypothetical protein